MRKSKLCVSDSVLFFCLMFFSSSSSSSSFSSFFLHSDLFWTNDCGKKNLDNYEKTSKEIVAGFQRLVDAILDGVWSAHKVTSVSRGLHRLEGKGLAC